MKPVREADIQRLCLQYLQLRKIPAWRANSGAVTIAATATTSRRFVKFSGAEGLSDIIGILPEQQGRFLAVEVKRPGNPPTEKQERFLEMVRQAGGLALVVSSVEELIAGLEAG